jgi:D-amino-acid dehydrogenase
MSDMESVSPTASADVAVIGGGAVGVAATFALAERGVSVVLLERGPELAWGCSAGNAGIVGASHVLPLAGPDALRDGVRWLRRPDSPFAIRPRPAVVPWLTRFCAASTPRQVERARRVLRSLAIESAQMHADLAAQGLDTGFQQRGLLNVYATDRAFAEATRAATSDRADGLRASVLDADAVAEDWPQITGRPAGAVLYEDEAHCNPTSFVRSVGKEATARGAAIMTGVEVLALRRRKGGVASLWTTSGEIRAEHVVLAAGAWSPQLTADLPVRLPVEGGKGYHVDLDVGHDDPGLPIWFQEHRVVVTPLAGRLRLAGTLELAGIDERVDPRRVEAVVEAARRGLAGIDNRRVQRVWRGLRPCTPDGLPIVGRVPSVQNLIVATGHGMWGLQLAPLTGRVIADIVAGEPMGGVLSELLPDRFGVPFSRRAAA